MLVKDPTAKQGVGTTTGKVEFGSVDLGISNKLGIVNESSNVLFDKDGNLISSASAEAFTRKYTRTHVNPSLCEDNVIGDIAKALNDFSAIPCVSCHAGCHFGIFDHKLFQE